jgi:putative sigma-54 modulation protein
MQINFTGHHVEVTTALKTFTQEKLEKLERHFDKITAIDVTFDVEKLRHIAEASIIMAKTTLHASAEATDMYTAVDSLHDKLNQQLQKHKEKMRDHRE